MQWAHIMRASLLMSRGILSSPYGVTSARGNSGSSVVRPSLVAHEFPYRRARSQGGLGQRLNAAPMERVVKIVDSLTEGYKVSVTLATENIAPQRGRQRSGSAQGLRPWRYSSE